MKGKLSNKVRVDHILSAIHEVEFYTKGLELEEFLKNSMMRFASIKQIEIIGEAVAHISDTLKSQYPEIDWSRIKGLRHILVHEYYGVDFELIWQVIQQDIPEFKTQIIKINSEI